MPSTKKKTSSQPQKLILDFDEDPAMNLGLLRLAKNVPAHEFFFHANNLNPFCLSRIEDLVVSGRYFSYSFPVFAGYDSENKTCLHFFANRSAASHEKEVQSELFTDEQDVKFLIDRHHDTDYIIKTTDPVSDFSVISLPASLSFAIQEYPLPPEDELYHILQYYE